MGSAGLGAGCIRNAKAPAEFVGNAALTAESDCMGMQTSRLAKSCLPETHSAIGREAIVLKDNTEKESVGAAWQFAEKSQ